MVTTHDIARWVFVDRWSRHPCQVGDAANATLLKGEVGPRILPRAMFDALLVVVIGILIVMPVVAILLMGLQRLSGRTWPPRFLAGSAALITLVVVIGYLLLVR